jgi:tRNA (mo5U34)-methyltransferase
MIKPSTSTQTHSTQTHTYTDAHSDIHPGTRSTLKDEIAALGHWFHNLHLPDGTQTAPDHPLGDFPAYKWKLLSGHLPQDLTGWKVLDIGCNAGFYSVKLAKRGAKVMGIDSDSRYLAQAKWAVRHFSLEDRITFHEMQVYDLAGVDEMFDLVLFMGVFYHLRYPTLALDIVSQRVSRMMVFQTLTMPGTEVYENTEGLDFSNREIMLEAGWPKMAFIEGKFSGDPTNWWVPNHACVEAVLRASGMRVTKAIGHEIYLCAPDPEHPSVVNTWNADELRSATGANRHRGTQ